jgi:hypothetical protein
MSLLTRIWPSKGVTEGIGITLLPLPLLLYAFSLPDVCLNRVDSWLLVGDCCLASLCTVTFCFVLFCLLSGGTGKDGSPMGVVWRGGVHMTCSVEHN